MAYYKFICTRLTEKECYIRRLFGNEGREIDKTGEQLDVEEGDTLYLHRLGGEDEPGWVYGPFVAASDAAEFIDPNAWSHQGPFDWQVSIDWDETVHGMSVDKINPEDGEDRTVVIERYPQKFSEVQGVFFTGLLKREGVAVIHHE